MMNDFSIIQKTNKGETKVMSIYIAAHLLTKEDIEKLTSGRKVRKGHYLYYLAPYEAINIDFESEDISNEVDPFGDLESYELELDEVDPFGDLELN